MSQQTMTRPSLPPQLAGLAGQLDGVLITPDHPDYEEARHVYNRLFERFPAAIARCGSTQDVVACVKAARSAGLPIAVRSGGHHVAGYATVDDGLVIDLGSMRDILVDVEHRRATVQPGVRVADLDRETFRLGYICATGTCEDVAVAGASLVGGFNFLASLHGMGCDNLVELEVVTASGEVLIANERQHPDLFWGMRGAGPNFGIATKLSYRLLEIPRKIFGGIIAYRSTDLAEQLRRLQAFVETAPDEVGIEATIFPTEESEVTGDTEPSALLMLEVSCVLPVEQAASVLEPLRSLGPVHYDFLRPIDFPWVNMTKGSRYTFKQYWTGEHVPALSEDVIQVCVDYARTARKTSVELGNETGRALFFFPYRGAMTRVAPDATAFGRRDPGWMIQSVTTWEGDDGESHIAWADGLRESLAPYGLGEVYLNSAMDEGIERRRAFYTDQKFRKLQRLKATYDPDNVFRLNANIPPDPNA
jgi:FAD/FMN-containing dehydrogenase